jgi:DNA-binding transcriptional LysR family regulator
MDLRQLEYVIAIADTRSFTRAAERCHTAQSALSHQVARLESQLGMRLFERTSRSVTLTRAGETLLPFAIRILNEVAEAREQLDGLDGRGTVRGHLRLGMTQTAGRVFDVVGLLGEYNRRYPEVELTIVTGPGHELIAAVRAGELDIALAGTGPGMPPAGIDFRPLGHDEPLVAVVSDGHRLAGRKRVALRELAETDRFVEFRVNTGLRDHVDALFRAAGIDRAVAFEVGQITEMVHFAGSGLGTAIVPRIFTTDDDAVRSARVLALSDANAAIGFGQFLQEGRNPAAVRAFAELVNR